MSEVPLYYLSSPEIAARSHANGVALPPARSSATQETKIFAESKMPDNKRPGSRRPAVSPSARGWRQGCCMRGFVRERGGQKATCGGARLAAVRLNFGMEALARVVEPRRHLLARNDVSSS